jgi:cytochrome c556
VTADLFVRDRKPLRPAAIPPNLHRAGGIDMKRVLIVGIILSVGIGAVLADADVIAQRRALMKSNGDAAKTLAGMLKGAPFDLAAAQASLKTFADVAAKMPALFPDNSKTGGGTGALPSIWENKSDFEARFATFGKDATAALAAVSDAASFKANVPKIFQNCGGCHEKYRAKDS